MDVGEVRWDVGWNMRRDDGLKRGEMRSREMKEKGKERERKEEVRNG
jgi:hypothetical protein